MYVEKITIDSQGFPTRRCYPFNIAAIQEPATLTFHRSVTFFVGENGSGKSTVLDAIARKVGIHIWDKPRRHLAHNNPYETKLSQYVGVSWNNGRVSGSLFRAETFRDLADFLDDVALCDPGRLAYHGGRILNTLSHGQGILSYFSGRLRMKGLYLLDEPEAALSPASQLKFLDLLRQLEDKGQSQFIIATHSPILLSYQGAQIYSFDRPRVEPVAYQDTTHYRIYRDFMAGQAAHIEA